MAEIEETDELCTPCGGKIVRKTVEHIAQLGPFDVIGAPSRKHTSTSYYCDTCAISYAMLPSQLNKQ